MKADRGYSLASTYPWQIGSQANRQSAQVGPSGACKPRMGLEGVGQAWCTQHAISHNVYYVLEDPHMAVSQDVGVPNYVLLFLDRAPY